MKKLLQFVLAVAFVWYFFLNQVDRHVVPQESELEPIAGTVSLVTELAGRDGRDGRVAVVIERPGWRRQLVSYDKSLLMQLPAGTVLEGGVFGASGENELWSLATNTGVTRTYEETFALRAEDLKDQRRTALIHGVLALGMVIVGFFLAHRFGEA
jgi:hypothetical protein